MSVPTINCADLEILLADYLDRALAAQEESTVERHLANCDACAGLARDAGDVMVLLANTPKVEAPAAMVEHILRATTQRPRWNPFAWLGHLRLSGILRPRWAMGLAMAAVSLVMIGRFWGVAENAAYRTWDRTMKRYENLEVVYEVRTQLQEWMEQRDSTIDQRDSTMEQRDSTIDQRDSTIDQRDSTMDQRDLARDQRELAAPTEPSNK